MTLMQRRRALMVRQGSVPRLPAEYQEVQYIESYEGKRSYIITNIVPQTSTPRVKLRYYKATQASSENPLFFAQSMGATKLEIGFNSTANRLFAFSHSSTAIVSPIIYGNVVDVDVQINSTSPYITMTASSGGTTETGFKTGANATGITDGQITLFSNMNGSMDCNARMYLCELWDNDALTAQFIPCYRKSDDVAGMYETVSETFYSSASKYPFSKGADV